MNVFNTHVSNYLIIIKLVINQPLTLEIKLGMDSEKMNFFKHKSKKYGKQRLRKITTVNTLTTIIVESCSVVGCI